MNTVIIFMAETLCLGLFWQALNPLVGIAYIAWHALKVIKVHEEIYMKCDKSLHGTVIAMCVAGLLAISAVGLMPILPGWARVFGQFSAVMVMHSCYIITKKGGDYVDLLLEEYKGLCKK